jgi:hypothetical protein
MPVTGLVAIPNSSATGTTVHFGPDETVRASGADAFIDVLQLATSWRELSVESRPGLKTLRTLRITPSRQQAQPR